MVEFYFTATQGKKAARIVVPSVTRCVELKAMLAAKGVHCGSTFQCGPSFERSVSEKRAAMSFLDLIL